MVSFITPDLNKRGKNEKKKKRKMKKKWCYILYVSAKRKRRRDAESKRHVSRSEAFFGKAMAR